MEFIDRQKIWIRFLYAACLHCKLVDVATLCLAGLPDTIVMRNASSFTVIRCWRKMNVIWWVWFATKQQNGAVICIKYDGHNGI